MSSSPTTGHADKPADPSLHSATQAPEELEGLKIVVLESAELATRSANMATNAGADLKAATKHLDTTLAIQKSRPPFCLRQLADSCWWPLLCLQP